MEMFTSLLYKAPAIKVIFENEREKSVLKNFKGDLVEYSCYYDSDPVKGKIIIELNKNKNVEHNGIKVELIGVIENYRDKRQNSRFIALTKDLEAPGQLNNEITQFEFEFANVEKQYETYKGKNIAVRYFLQTTLSSKYKTIINEAEFVILKPKSIEDFDKDNKSMRIEVGIEDWIHVCFEVDKSKYFLRDSVNGQVIFKKVSVRLNSMEIQIIKRETLGTGANASVDNEVIARFEVMDGAPIKNESIPIRLFLQAYNNLTPTYINVNNRFSVQYFFNIVLIDQEDRRFFKHLEITTFRADKKKAIQQ